ncbi:MAG TPA: phosphopantetheine-binding protein, partial [Polyangiaceae bacterium]|nr:phosphopantetheine-binding protein [Polyangiaceae bacterium]
LSSSPAPSHLAADGGRIEIGNRVNISYGAAISARLEVVIGDGVELGPFAVIMDSDFHVVGDRNAIDEPASVRIDAGARLGSRVTVLRGAWIGAGAVVLDGSVVSGRIAAGAVVAGVPARALAAAGEANGAAVDVELPALVMSVLGLPSLPLPSHGPAEIREWDSLGALKLVLAIEEAFGISLSEQELKSLDSVAQLALAVTAAKSRHEASSELQDD